MFGFKFGHESRYFPQTVMPIMCSEFPKTVVPKRVLFQFWEMRIVSFRRHRYPRPEIPMIEQLGVPVLFGLQVPSKELMDGREFILYDGRYVVDRYFMNLHEPQITMVGPEYPFVRRKFPLSVKLNVIPTDPGVEVFCVVNANAFPSEPFQDFLSKLRSLFVMEDSRAKGRFYFLGVGS